MDVYFELPILHNSSVVCLGNFDGVHKGHRHLIQMAVKCAKALDLSSVVLTFEPHPEHILFPDRGLRKILTNDLKTELIAGLGVDILIYLPFTVEIANMSPVDFITKILKKNCMASHIFAGFNYSFGKDAAGNAETLQHYSSLLNYRFCVVPPFKVDESIVSSSLIRSILEQGKIEEAMKFLGYWPMLRGTVIHGDQRGRRLGFPTANLLVEDEIVIPANGVYACLTRYKNQIYLGMANIGMKPTIGTNLPKTIEINIFDFKEEIYGTDLAIQLCSYIRPERAFNSLACLQKQLIRDRKATENYFCNKLANNKSL